MFRLLPPRGRALVVTVLCMVLWPATAWAADLSVPDPVTGRDPLTITVPGAAGPWTVSVTDARDRTAQWTSDDGGELTLDLTAPQTGSAPVNGTARVAAEGPAGVTLSAPLTIDMDPATPVLTVAVRGQRATLRWDAVSAPGKATYRVERATAGSDWTVLTAATSAHRYADRDLRAGRYRYRVTALVASADGGVNTSRAAAEQARIAAPAPAPTSQAPQVPAPTPPKLPDPPKKKAADKPKTRNVAATGGVRGPVTPDGGPSAGGQSTAAGPTITANGPSLSSDSLAVGDPAAVTPPTAAPPDLHSSTEAIAPAPPAVAAPPGPLPVTIPPAGALAVEAGSAFDDDAVALLAAVVFLGLGITYAHRRLGADSVIRLWAGLLSRRRPRDGRSRRRGLRSARSSGTPEPS